MTEYLPRHMESMAQIVAQWSGGGERVLGTHKNPMNLGGGNRSGELSVKQIASRVSGSLVTEESDVASGITAMQSSAD
jgi:hypothetical protein